LMVRKKKGGLQIRKPIHSKGALLLRKSWGRGEMAKGGGEKKKASSKKKKGKTKFSVPLMGKDFCLAGGAGKKGSVGREEELSQKTQLFWVKKSLLIGKGNRRRGRGYMWKRGEKKGNDKKSEGTPLIKRGEE